MRDLTILTVTKGEPCAVRFLEDMANAAVALEASFVVGLDHGVSLPIPLRQGRTTLVHVESKGYLESVLQDVVDQAPQGWVLRLDDDERISHNLFAWLMSESYRASDHWKFPRAHLWESEDQFICTPPLWPDWQTRLSTRGKSGGRYTVHAGSPHGGGKECVFPIEHHKFLAKDRDERLRIAEVYDRFHPGYGTGAGMLPFSVPELAFPDLRTHLRDISEAAA